MEDKIDQIEIGTWITIDGHVSHSATRHFARTRPDLVRDYRIRLKTEVGVPYKVIERQTDDRHVHVLLRSKDSDEVYARNISLRDTLESIEILRQPGDTPLSNFGYSTFGL